ncbi:MAG: RsmD family RNA methyltransferase [Balneola sp.]|nr:RsmD family RNA methyltransferase [Balneola sp.]MBO6652172.1 RsmD family RNA methyltransferase [Balneola sp.]MBO6710701.1 RsmD family RNA methyltransferase [Balneola sp.]MBO6799387.1 RsmD family RNA methyltransferase [Balneola sp.]MBO6869484.1 RsmD family RNA methyltransferase [Balneola sp.]
MKNKFSEESIDFIKDHINDDPAEIMLQSRKFPELPMRDIVVQIASRQKAKDKLPEWFGNYELILPPKQNLEQASSEITAKFKARFVEGDSLVDLTGGTGVDTFYLSRKMRSTVYLEPNEELCTVSKHNFEVLGANIEVQNSTAENVLKQSSDHFNWIFIDPSRRDDSQNRVYALEDCVPNVIELEEQLLNSAENVLIKASPMLDIKKTLEQFSSCYKVQVVAVDNEVKELLIYLNKEFLGEADIEAWNISVKREEELFSFKYSDEESCDFDIGEPQKYLYEPNAPLMKAGAYKLIGLEFGVQKLHPNTHLYTSEELIENFPGKKLLIKEEFSPAKKQIKKRVKNDKVNVIVRNYPMGANEIKKKFGLKDGGEGFLIFCKIEGNGLKAIWCERV